MKNFLARLLILALFFMTTQSVLFMSRAQAMDQDTRTVIRGGTYGLVGGTVVGLAVLPLTGSVRGVFIGSSLGLYMGLIMGVYRATQREDGGRRAEEAELQPQIFTQMSPRTPMEMPLSTRASFSIPVARF